MARWGRLILRDLLAGLRVLDFGRYVAGPYCATLLGYLGADVIRVERPGGGEDRAIQPLAHDADGTPRAGALFFHTGCNKRGLCLDQTRAGGPEVLRRLVATADMVVANLPDAALSRLGIDHDSLRAIRPDIILLVQTMFGPDGPRAGKPGFDGVGQAMSGAMAFTGLPGAPAKAAAPYVDYATAVLAAFGALAALRERDRTGRGQRVDAALLRTALAAFGVFVAEQAALGLDRVPSGNRVQTSGPSDCFACRDGHVLVHVVGDGLFRRVARLIGADDWLADPALVGDAARGRAADRLCDRLGQWCAGRGVADAVGQLEAAGVPCGPVLSLRDAADDPHVRAANWLTPVAIPDLAFAVPTVDLPLGFSAGPAGIATPPPALGADGAAILGELGYAEAEIAAMLRSGGCCAPESGTR